MFCQIISITRVFTRSFWVCKYPFNTKQFGKLHSLLTPNMAEPASKKLKKSDLLEEIEENRKKVSAKICFKKILHKHFFT